MEEIYHLIKESSPVLVALVVIAYLLKNFLEKKIEGIEDRITEIARTSLDIKKDLRTEERDDLVKFRIAVEKWEDFLQRALCGYTMQDAAKADVRTLYDEETKLFLKVKLTLVSAGVYLRNPKLEYELRETIIRIRKLYTPLIHENMPALIDLQMQLVPLETKLKRFQATGDMAFAPTQMDLELSRKLQAGLTEGLKKFSETLLAKYPPIAEQLLALKDGINQYIYRRVEHADMDKE